MENSKAFLQYTNKVRLSRIDSRFIAHILKYKLSNDRLVKLASTICLADNQLQSTDHVIWLTPTNIGQNIKLSDQIIYPQIQFRIKMSYEEENQSSSSLEFQQEAQCSIIIFDDSQGPGSNTIRKLHLSVFQRVPTRVSWFVDPCCRWKLLLWRKQ